MKKVRGRGLPSCRSPEELNKLMIDSDLIFENFGKFREQDFYRRLISTTNYSASLFVLEQVAQSLPNRDVHLFCDGTFKTRPRGVAQVLVVFAIIAGKVNNTHFLLL